MKIQRLMVSLFVFAVSANAYSQMIPNTKNVDIYNKQLKETMRIFSATQETLTEATPVFDMYKKLGYTTPEVIAISKRFIQLENDAAKLYGKDLISNPTPFSSCAMLPSTAYSIWMARLNAKTNNDVEMVNSLGQSYIKSGKECVSAMKNPPPDMIEESDDLEIIDVDTP
ncbi:MULTISPECIES: hypothetical protein [Enterobacteriaceae]|uniref:Uncharacterized protein n=1 Tax=Enterobacter roggenkampii TaxID=1812935 RepID=A0ABY0J886_9ENTR|nr:MULTISPECIES: hypothetical protein [Enterobacteriaceae]MEC3924623.1 hypothetical protein [Citrobacter braakii]WRT75664.1 hypothetical protein VKE28_13685 [Salmonella enterica]SAB43042.1 Uncharacterised protein [Enterobacter roggenkampii]